MTNEQINQRISEAIGWTDIHDSGPWHHHKMWGYPPEKPGQCGNAYNYLPDYCSDLNAMHEAEKELDSDELFRKYYLALYDVTQSTKWPVCATARQRAEAFLRTLGKWEEN
jgi:hypothetical protein